MESKIELNKIHNIDCLEFMKTLPDKCIDLTVTSPPYGEIRDYNGFSFEFKPIAEELFRITKDGGVLVWVVADQTVDGSETGESFRQVLYFKEVGFNIHDTMIYDKGKVVFPDANRYHPCFEYMFILSKGKPKTTNLIADRENKYPVERKTSSYRQKDGSVQRKATKATEDKGIRYNIWTYANGYMQTTSDKYAFEHPAMFPEKLAQDHIKSWSNEGDIVFDPMMGSGTTAKMAQLLKRKWLGCEISPEYCKIAEDRIKSISNPLF